MSDLMFILCCHGGSDCFEPYVSLWESPAAARKHYANLPDDGGEGGSYFIEPVRLNGPGLKPQVESGSNRRHD